MGKFIAYFGTNLFCLQWHTSCQLCDAVALSQLRVNPLYEQAECKDIKVENNLTY